MIEAVFGEAADLEVFDEHVGVDDELLDQRATLGRFEIRLDAALAAVAAMIIGRAEVAAIGRLDKGRSPLPRIVARARALDLHHVGAEIGEQLAAPRPRENAGEFEHANIDEGRFCHVIREAGERAP